ALGLEESALAGGRGPGEEAARVAYVGPQRSAVFFEPGLDLAQLMARRAIDAGEDEVFPLQQAGEALAQLGGVGEVARLEGLFLVFVRVEGRDALARGAVFVRAEPPLLQRVLLLVPGQEQASAFAYHEVFRSYVNSICPEQLDF